MGRQTGGCLHRPGIGGAALRQGREHHVVTTAGPVVRLAQRHHARDVGRRQAHAIHIVVVDRFPGVPFVLERLVHFRPQGRVRLRRVLLARARLKRCPLPRCRRASMPPRPRRRKQLPPRSASAAPARMSSSPGWRAATISWHWRMCWWRLRLGPKAACKTGPPRRTSRIEAARGTVLQDESAPPLRPPVAA